MTLLVVHLNRGALHSVEPATETVEVAGPFAIKLRNHGQAVHVHLRLDDDLARVADLDGTNLFVDTESDVTVPVDVADESPPLQGTLAVVSGYGKGEEHVEIRLVDEVGDQVAVDEDLGRPDARSATARADVDGADGGGGRATDALAVGRVPVAVKTDVKGALLVGGLILVALALAGIALLAAPGLAVVLGILAVLVGVGVAAYVMVR